MLREPRRPQFFGQFAGDRPRPQRPPPRPGLPAIRHRRPTAAPRPMARRMSQRTPRHRLPAVTPAPRRTRSWFQVNVPRVMAHPWPIVVAGDHPAASAPSRRSVRWKRAARRRAQDFQAAVAAPACVAGSVAGRDRPGRRLEMTACGCSCPCTTPGCSATTSRCAAALRPSICWTAARWAAGRHRPRHQIQVNGGVTDNGIGVRLSGQWRSADRVVDDAARVADLRFSALATLDLRIFADPRAAVPRKSWARGLRTHARAAERLRRTAEGHRRFRARCRWRISRAIWIRSVASWP